MAYTNTISEGHMINCAAAAGVVKLYFQEFNETNIITEDATGILSITDNAAVPAPIVFFPYNSVQNTGEIANNMIKTLESNSSGYEISAFATFGAYEQSIINKIKLLSLGKFLIIGKDRNGQYVLVGKSDGASMITNASGTGKALGDRVGFELEFKAFELDMAPIVNLSNITFAVDGTITVSA